MLTIAIPQALITNKTQIFQRKVNLYKRVHQDKQGHRTMVTHYHQVMTKDCMKLMIGSCIELTDMHSGHD